MCPTVWSPISGTTESPGPVVEMPASAAGYGNHVDPPLLISSAQSVGLLKSAKSARGKIRV
jgi:hypothetical protein